MKWMLNVWFSIALFIFACVFSFIAEIYRYHFVIQIIFTISACLLVAGLGYIADLQSKNNNKKLSDLGKALLILFFFSYIYVEFVRQGYLSRDPIVLQGGLEVPVTNNKNEIL